MIFANSVEFLETFYIDVSHFLMDPKTSELEVIKQWFGTCTKGILTVQFFYFLRYFHSIAFGRLSECFHTSFVPSPKSGKLKLPLV